MERSAITEAVMPDEFVMIVGVLGSLFVATLGAYWLLNRDHEYGPRKH